MIRDHFTYEETAKILTERGIKCSPFTVGRWCRRGKLKRFKIGSVVAISQQAIDQFIQKQTS